MKGPECAGKFGATSLARAAHPSLAVTPLSRYISESRTFFSRTMNVPDDRNFLIPRSVPANRDYGAEQRAPVSQPSHVSRHRSQLCADAPARMYMSLPITFGATAD